MYILHFDGSQWRPSMEPHVVAWPLHKSSLSGVPRSSVHDTCCEGSLPVETVTKRTTHIYIHTHMHAYKDI